MPTITPEFAREIFESQKDGLKYLEDIDAGLVEWENPLASVTKTHPEPENIGIGPMMFLDDTVPLDTNLPPILLSIIDELKKFYDAGDDLHFTLKAEEFEIFLKSHYSDGKITREQFLDCCKYVGWENMI